jgi:glycerophosphoryl diester phosphodiesterase
MFKISALVSVCFLLASIPLIVADRPLIIGHRGSCGMFPEHTVEGYEKAVEQGADFIECDLTITRDLQLICLHEAWINATTDVSQHPQFADRIRTYDVPGFGKVTDYFSVDFTLDEIKSLRKVQQLNFRDQSYNGKFQVATFDEHVQVAKNAGRIVGIYPEIKDPKFLNRLPILNNTRIEDLVLAALQKYGYTKKSDECIVQSFDEDTLKYVSPKTELRLMMLTETGMPSDAKIDEWSKYIYAVGPSKNQIVPSRPSVTGSNKMRLGKPTDFVEKIHRKNMKVHAYTFRNEDRYLAVDYGQDENLEYEMFEKLGVDGFFTDFPATMHRYIQFTNTAQRDMTTTPKATSGSARVGASVNIMAMLMRFV